MCYLVPRQTDLAKAKDEVVIRSNGAPTDFASDIAHHYDVVRRGFERVINVWAVDHQGHMPRMSTVMQALRLDPARPTIVLYNLVKLVRDGRRVLKLSKRKGNLLTIGDVVEEVGADAALYLLTGRRALSTSTWTWWLPRPTTIQSIMFSTVMPASARFGKGCRERLRCGGGCG